MPEFEDLVDEDFILDLIYNISKVASEEGAYAGEMDYQKILYLLKKRLSDDPEINRSLQFYWYLHGPYSTLIADGVQTLVQNNDLKTSDQSKGKGYVLDDDNSQRKLNNTIINEFNNIVEDYNFFEPREEILKNIYSNAPYKFQRYYKFEFKPLIEEIEDESSFVLPEDRKRKLMNKMMMAEGKLPENNKFPKFNQVFSRFVTLSDTFFENLETKDYPEGLDHLCDISKEMWSVFCNRLRILEHDPYYDHQVEKWERIYKRSLKTLSEKIENFDMFISESTENYQDIEETRSDEDSPWGTVAQSLISE